MSSEITMSDCNGKGPIQSSLSSPKSTSPRGIQTCLCPSTYFESSSILLRQTSCVCAPQRCHELDSSTVVARQELFYYVAQHVPVTPVAENFAIMFGVFGLYVIPERVRPLFAIDYKRHARLPGWLSTPMLSN